jgi:hypothetical protein
MLLGFLSSHSMISSTTAAFHMSGLSLELMKRVTSRLFQLKDSPKTRMDHPSGDQFLLSNGTTLEKSTADNGT